MYLVGLLMATWESENAMECSAGFFYFNILNIMCTACLRGMVSMYVGTIHGNILEGYIKQANGLV